MCLSPDLVKEQAPLLFPQNKRKIWSCKNYWPYFHSQLDFSACASALTLPRAQDVIRPSSSQCVNSQRQLYLGQVQMHSATAAVQRMGEPGGRGVTIAAGGHSEAAVQAGRAGQPHGRGGHASARAEGGGTPGGVAAIQARGKTIQPGRLSIPKGRGVQHRRGGCKRGRVGCKGGGICTTNQCGYPSVLSTHAPAFAKVWDLHSTVRSTQAIVNLGHVEQPLKYQDKKNLSERARHLCRLRAGFDSMVAAARSCLVPGDEARYNGRTLCSLEPEEALWSCQVQLCLSGAPKQLAFPLYIKQHQALWVPPRLSDRNCSYTHTHTHTHIYVYKYSALTWLQEWHVRWIWSAGGRLTWAPLNKSALHEPMPEGAFHLRPAARVGACTADIVIPAGHRVVWQHHLLGSDSRCSPASC